MSHTDYLTAQQRSARVLDTLLSMRLPEAEWSISTVYPDKLDGQISRSMRSLEQARADLATWATAFNAAVDWNRLGGQWPHVVFTVNGVTVRVWTYATGEVDTR
ncbi:hypothetical protein [Nocardiopsis ansamitocini]|uniref:Uncharacterized protein n=1 Tax=Nocardiopsis ansamitocini TaxID=1670832 RepID=A0A9W6P387_9ACTN|nr:hypothetical protein [Nocardiopsis ansamitocini]GLU46299.1 hypothetical protein Nans01_06500 [Nocardiopsis ansamitocini]